MNDSTHKSRHEGVKDSRDEAIRPVVKGRERSMNDSTYKSRHEGVKGSRDAAIRPVVKGRERTMDLQDMWNRRDATAVILTRPQSWRLGVNSQQRRTTRDFLRS